MNRSILAALLLCAVSSCGMNPAFARHYAVDPSCNVTMPCEGVTTSPRGERVVWAMRGLGVAKQVYRPDSGQSAVIVAHPSGCPARSFCACGAAVRVFGSPIRSLWQAANWFKFPRAAPAAGMVAVRRHHVFVLEADLGGGQWRVYDANSGGHATRIHARSLAGYVIVNPHGAGLS